MKDETLQTTALIEELAFLLKKGNAHVNFSDAVSAIPFNDLGKKPGNVPYSIWQLTEHIRIAQKDILDFSANLQYKELKWPDDYWPENPAPPSEEAWENSVRAIGDDLNTFIALLQNAEDIFSPFDHGTGQTLLREAMVIADHNSYHTGEIIVIRRLLGNWK